MSGAYIFDGYSEWFELKAEEGLYEAVHAEIRPMTSLEISRLSSVTDKLEGEQQRRRIAELLVPHIIEWDLKDEKGQTLPISAQTLLRLRQQVYSWFLHSVCGNVKAVSKDQKNSLTG